MNMPQQLQSNAVIVEDRLRQLLATAMPSREAPRLIEAMEYAVLGGGKRFRPFLVIESARMLGIPPARSRDVAAAVELVHAYSLVHDDLPAMDDDDLRRGRPTVHIAFGESTAILAGDALLTFAFELLAHPDTHPDAAVRCELALALARAAGAAGMAGGQQLDLEASNDPHSAGQDAGRVLRIQALKTGALMAFSAEAGAILALAPPPERKSLAGFGHHLGAAFQIADDLLDVEGTAARVGKATGKDAAAGKATYITVLGIEGARARLREHEAAAAAALEPFGHRADLLRQAVAYVTSRQS